MRGLRWIIPLITTVILLSSVGLVSAQMANTAMDTSAGPAIGYAKLLAQAVKKPGSRKGYVGVFTTPVTAGLVATFQPKQGRPTVDIRIPEEGLIIRTPGRPHDGSKTTGREKGSLQGGTEVAVLVEFDVDGNAIARRILVKPVPVMPYIGVVTGVETNEDGVRILTILRHNGKAKKVRLGPEFDPPEIGEVVTALPGRSDRARGSSEGDESRPPIVKGLVRAETVGKRVQGFLRSLTAGNGPQSDKAAERRVKRVDRVAAILESHADLKVAIIEKLSQKQNLTPSAVKGLVKGLGEARAARTQARADAKAARIQARAEAKAARDNARPPADPGRPGTTGQPAGATAGDEGGQDRPGRQDGVRGRP